LGRLRPSKQTDEPVLKDESNAYAGVEASEIGGHGRNRKVRTSDIGTRAPILDTWIGCIVAVRWRSVGKVLCGQDLGEEADQILVPWFHDCIV
jgi:hypothetical protein